MTFNRRFIRVSLGLVVSGLALLMAIIASALYFIGNTNDSFDELVAERSIRSAAADLFSLLQDAETGQRGYLLTLNPDFLEPYHTATAELEKAEERLVKLLDNHPDYESDMALVYDLIDAKRAEMEETIQLARAGKIKEAEAIVQKGFGENLMSGIRDRMQAILDEADLHIEALIKAQIEGSNNLRWIVIGAGVAIVVVLGGAIYVIERHIRSLSAARHQVLALNQDLERRVEERTEDLVRANQEVQRFAYIVTHDLRAPLVNIMGFTSELEMSLTQMKSYVLADGEPLSPQEIMDARRAAETEVPEAIEFIRSSTQKMDGLINAILKISRDGRRELKPERLEIKEIVENSVASLQGLIDAVDGEAEIDMPSLKITSDRLSLEQIFTNLIDNAIKYRNPERPLSIVVSGAQTGRFLQVEVKDNGRGIAPEDQERVFELFRRAGQQNQKGDGIGLAHVRSMARNLGGDITVRSKSGEGATFILRIPANLQEFLKRI